MMTLLQKRTEILARPSFRFFDPAGTALIAGLNYCINLAAREYYEGHRESNRINQATNEAAPITLPTGTTWGANGKIYIIPNADLPANMSRLLKLWVTNAAGAITYSSSDYDTDTGVGSGIPDNSDESLDLTNVYHEVIGEVGTATIEVYVGTTAQGTTPKCAMNYVKTFTALSGDSDLIPVPDHDLLSTFDDKVSRVLRANFGYDF